MAKYVQTSAPGMYVDGREEVIFIAIAQIVSPL